MYAYKYFFTYTYIRRSHMHQPTNRHTAFVGENEGDNYVHICIYTCIDMYACT
jgi:hypothetical protein